MGEEKDSERTARPAPPSAACAFGQLAPGRHEIAPGLPRTLQRDRLRAVGIVEAEHGRLDPRARGPERRGVRGVSLDLGRSPFVALDDQAVGAPAERHGRRVVAGDPRDDVLGSGDIGDDLFDGAPASSEPRERQRGAQEHHHVAPGDPFGKLRGSLRELTLEKGAGFGALLELPQTSPVCPCHRWHPEQSVGGLTGRSRSSCAASVPTSRGGVHFMLVTSRDGASVGTGVAVAVEAPAHAEGRHLGDRLHLVDAAVAGDAADSCGHVRVMGEVGVVGKLVHANPVHRPAALGAFPNRCELLAVPLHGLMAVHAGLRGRNVRDGRSLDRGVTVSAIETKLADVERWLYGTG